jgi:pimeloyl-ACP methyl ester carboxylesterase
VTRPHSPDDAPRNQPHIHSDEAGADDAPLIVLVHGAMDRSAGLLKLSRRLDHDHRVLRYDRRGYGRSGHHPGPFTMPYQVDDLLALLREREAIIVGHSYGGNVALAAAARRPDLVRGVVVYETPLSWEPWWPKVTPSTVAIASAHDTEEAAEAFMRRLIGNARWEALPERTRATRRAEGAALVTELADLRAHRPWRAEQITMPVWAGVGEHGAPHQQRGMRQLGETLPECHVVELAGCHHMANTTHPDRFRHELIDPLLRRLADG